ncbi:MAG: hypothetical protein ACI4T9_08600 [Prevotella sp.]
MDKIIINTILLVLTLGLFPAKASAQVDPTLSAMIIRYTEMAKNQYDAQLGKMGAQTEGHIWLTAEVEATKNFQRQFDEYLSTFRNIISYAAQIYGFYYEVNHLTENMQKLSSQIGDAPVNAVAVALHRNRNDIYVDIINRSVGILNTIRQVCIDKKMTEKQRIELVFSIRPKLKEMNRQLQMLTKLVKHTNMAQVWYEIEYQSLPHRAEKAGIVEESLGKWRVNARSVKPNKH